MLSKLSALRLIATSSFLFLSLLLFSFSCEDHPEPPRIFPVINTLDIVRVNDDPTFKYQVQFTELGNQEIAEYGIVTYAGSANENITPTIPVVDNLKGRKYDFSGPTYMPPNLSVKGLTKTYDGPSGQIRLFYRAYARLANNFVVYGQVKFADFFVAAPQPIILPVIQTIGGAQTGANFQFKVHFPEEGNAPIKEYGMAYSIKPTNLANYVPTVADSKAKFDANQTKSEVLGKVIYTQSFPIGAQTNVLRNVFLRSYVMLEDNTVIYGETTSFTFTH